MKYFLYVLHIASVFVSQVSAQQDTSKALTFSGYLEGYYAYDFTETSNNERPSFVYNHKRTHQPAINIALVRASYQTTQKRANLGLMAGTYVSDNLRTEPDGLRHIYEANAGIRLSAKHAFWLDAGVLPSHLGLATPIGADNYTLTRSLASENSPYYETGIRLSYQSMNTRWYWALLVVNGWQRIQRPGPLTIPSFGSQITYKPSSTLTLNSSSYIGIEASIPTQPLRVFHNFYTVFQPTRYYTVAACFDIGSQQQPSSNNQAIWYTAFLQNRFMFSEKWSTTARLEYYSDKHQIIVQTESAKSFQTTGYSLNLDYRPFHSTTVRLEGKLYNSIEKVFNQANGTPISVYSGLTFAVAYAF